MKVSIIVPTYNEEQCIAACLDSILAQTCKDIIEILVVDACSTDSTLGIIESFRTKNDKIRVFTNHKRHVPYAWNIGIRNSHGDLICIEGAHSYLSKDYIERCVELHREHPDFDNIGGKSVVLPRNDTLTARAVAMAISHPLGIGKAQYRQANKPCFVYTLFPGCYKRTVFSRVGLYDERLVRGEDQEINDRILKSGGKIYLDPSIQSFFYARGTLKGMVLLYFRTGKSIPCTSRVMSRVISVRQLAPLAYFSALGASLLLAVAGRYAGVSTIASTVPLLLVSGVYTLAIVAASVVQAFKNRTPSFAFLLPVVFFLLHAGYAIGTLHGLITLRGWWNRNKDYKVGKLTDMEV